MDDVTFGFEGRTLVLSGACGGIGRAIAATFAAAGAALVLGDRDARGLAELERDLGAGERVVPMPMNCTLPEDAEALADLAEERFGGIDFLVPAAGIYPAEPFATMTDAQWRQTLSVNLDGVFYLCRRAASRLREGSAIVMLTSLAAHRGAVSNAHYAASKGALGALTRSLARELAPRSRVNAIAPGIIDTPMIGDYRLTRGAETLRQTPMGRFGAPAEVASVVAFLCSSAAGFVNGETIQVNGGLYMA